MPKKLLKYFGGAPYSIDPATGKEKANDFPTFAGFCAENDTYRSIVLAWAEKHPEMNKAYQKAKELQEAFLITNTIKNLYAQPFAIFAAKNLLKWTDRSEVDHTTKGEAIGQFNFVSAEQADKAITPPDEANQSNNKTNS